MNKAPFGLKPSSVKNACNHNSGLVEIKDKH